MDFFIHFMTCQYFPETLYSRKETWTVSFYLRKPWIKKGMQKTESADSKPTQQQQHQQKEIQQHKVLFHGALQH